MFENLTIGHILIILVVVLLLFGAKRLPEIGQSMGKGIREFKKSISDVGNELRTPEPPERLVKRDDNIERSRMAAEPQEESRPEPKRLLP